MNGFMVCAFCDRSGGDICDYRMWQKTDKYDKPIDDYFIACTNEPCRKQIDDDPMLFASADEVEDMLGGDALAAFYYKRLGHVRDDEGRSGERSFSWGVINFARRSACRLFQRRLSSRIICAS